MLIYVPLSTAGSVENIARLAEAGRRCAPAFAVVQDGIPVPPDAGLEMLGSLPEPESLLLLGRHNHTFLNFTDLRGASIGIGPEGSGTAYLVGQLFEDPDLRDWVFSSPITSWRTKLGWSAKESSISPPS